MAINPSALRMRNLFPTNSSVINQQEEDPTADIISQIHDAISQRPSGLQQVARMNPNVIQGYQSNPGAAMAANAQREGDRIYDSYSKPLPTAGQALALSGIKPNDQDLPGNTAHTDIELNRDLKRSQIQKNLNPTSRSKVITIADPNDPTKQINANYDPETETITPIRLGPDGKSVQSGGQAKLNQTQADKDKLEGKNEDLLRQHAKDALAEMDNISKSTGKLDNEGNSIEELNPATQNITGASGNIPSGIMDLSPDNATVRASIKRLTSMLTLNRMQELKNQSKTGTTGFGSNMNQKEFSALVSSASKLETMNQSEPGYAKELGRVRTLLGKVANGSSPSSTNPQNEVPKGKIRVRNKETGQSGMMSEGAFNPAKYERIQ